MAEAGHASSAVVVWDDIERLLGVTMTSTDGSDVHLISAVLTLSFALQAIAATAAPKPPLLLLLLLLLLL